MINLVSIYIAPDAKVGRTEIRNLFDAVAHLNNLILTGDFNAQSAAWGSDNSRGGCILEFIRI